MKRVSNNSHLRLVTLYGKACNVNLRASVECARVNDRDGTGPTASRGKKDPPGNVPPQTSDHSRTPLSAPRYFRFILKCN